MGRACNTHEREEKNTKVWLENLKGRDQSEDLGVDGKTILEWILEKYGGKGCTGCIWLSIQIAGGLLWTRRWTYELHKRRGISWLAEWVLASQQGLCSIELVRTATVSLWTPSHIFTLTFPCLNDCHIIFTASVCRAYPHCTQSLLGKHWQ